MQFLLILCCLLLLVNVSSWFHPTGFQTIRRGWYGKHHVTMSNKKTETTSNIIDAEIVDQGSTMRENTNDSINNKQDPSPSLLQELLKKNKSVIEKCQEFISTKIFHKEATTTDKTKKSKKRKQKSQESNDFSHFFSNPFKPTIAQQQQKTRKKEINSLVKSIGFTGVPAILAETILSSVGTMLQESLQQNTNHLQLVQEEVQDLLSQRSPSSLLPHSGITSWDDIHISSPMPTSLSSFSINGQQEERMTITYTLTPHTGTSYTNTNTNTLGTFTLPFLTTDTTLPSSAQIQVEAIVRVSAGHHAEVEIVEAVCVLSNGEEIDLLDDDTTQRIYPDGDGTVIDVDLVKEDS